MAEKQNTTPGDEQPPVEDVEAEVEAETPEPKAARGLRRRGGGCRTTRSRRLRKPTSLSKYSSPRPALTRPPRSLWPRKPPRSRRHPPRSRQPLPRSPPSPSPRLPLRRPSLRRRLHRHRSRSARRSACRARSDDSGRRRSARRRRSAGRSCGWRSPSTSAGAGRSDRARSSPTRWTRRSSSASTRSRRTAKYKKVVRRSRKFHAHDERNEAKVGDVVRIVETRPLSAMKRWRLTEIVEAAK